MCARIILCISALLIPCLAKSAVFLQEAAVRTGYGPTQETWSIHWSGACAERVGIEVGFLGHAELTQILPRVISYTRDSVPHVQRQCPDVEIIQVNVPTRDKETNLPKVYQYEMHRSDNWASRKAHWNSDFVRDSLASGYLPADAGYHHALVRFDDGRFEAAYGKYLDGHLSGTRVERHMLEGATPPRVSHHTISGLWYEIGSERPNGSCEASRDGYALWGSFTLVINPGSTRLKTIKKFCAEADEKGHSEEIYFSVPSPSGFEREWGIEWVKFTDPLHEKLAAMALDTAAGAEAFASTRKPLYQSVELTLYPAQPNWCMNRRMDAYYRVASEERDQAFGGNYAQVLGERARRVVNEYCGDALTASVSNYSEGDETPWDRMSFQFRPIQASAFGNDDGYLKLLDQHLSERAQAHLDYLTANHLGPACSDGPFCELPGGRYLNAIYNGRGDQVLEMDRLNRAEVNEMLSGQMAELNMTENPITQLFSGLIESDDGLIVGAANKYMYAFAAWGRQCLKPGATTRTFVHTTPDVETINFDGSTDYQPGETYEATYTVNPEFFGLLERLGSHYGAPDSDSPFLNKAQRLVLQGLVRMKDDYDCHSPEVARFEQNLILLAEDDLADRPLRVLATPPAVTGSEPAAGTAVRTATERSPEPVSTTMVAPPEPTPQVSVPTRTSNQPAEGEADPVSPLSNNPVVDRSPSPMRSRTTPATTTQTRAPVAAAASEPVAGTASTLSQAERYAQMNAELKALSNEFVNEVNVRNAEFGKKMRSAGSDAERLEMMRVFQAEMAQMRTAVERETQAIRDKYQQ